MEEAERKLAKELAVLPKNCKESQNLRTLIDKGLVRKVNSKYEISIGFYADYLKTIDNNDRVVMHMTKTEELTEEIFRLFSTINEQRKRKKKEIIFDVTEVDFNLFKDLKRLCQSDENFKTFIGAVYLTFLEKTKKEGKAGNKLPTIIRFSTFGNAIDILRHVYGGHLEEKMKINAGQMTKSTALRFFIGTEHIPFHPDEFVELQIAVLTKYKEELVRLLKFVRSED